MGEVQVADRGSREIVVFLSGDVDDLMTDELHAAVDEVARLEQLSGLDHAVVDLHNVTSLGPAGIAFLRELQVRGERAAFEVSFSHLSSTAHRALEAAGWSFVEASPHLPE